MTVSCGNSWSSWRGGGPLPGNGGDAGAFWIGDLMNLPDARSDVLDAEPGAYIDVFIGSAEIANFICRVQHQLAGAVHHAKVISPFYSSRLGAYDNSVLDLTDDSELEIVVGALATWSGGITTSGNFNFLFHFYGQDFESRKTLMMQALVWDAIGSPSNDSIYAGGWLDPTTPASSIWGGLSSLTTGAFWLTAFALNTAVSRDTTVPSFVFDNPSRVMQTTNNPDARLTTYLSYASSASGALSPVIGAATSHASFAGDAQPYVLDRTLSAPPTYTTTAAKCAAGGPAVIQSVIEVISGSVLPIPAPGY